MRNALLIAIAASIPLARAHIGCFHPAMWGWNLGTDDALAFKDGYDNRPVAPLQGDPFDKWWFHNHLKDPPPPNTYLELPAGGTAMTQLACNMGATEYWRDGPGHTDLRKDDYPCPGSPTAQFHGLDDVKGCGLSIAYTSDVNSLQPEDLAIFSVNHTCVWKVSTGFQVPKDMPPCPDGGCICAWHWIHSADSGSEQMYMNGFRCKVTGSTSNTPIMKPEVPKRCTGDLSKCNQGAQQPLYWLQAERNNMFNPSNDPPFYLNEWGFIDGAQNQIFGNNSNTKSTLSSTPVSVTVSTPASNKPSPTSVGSKSSSTSKPQALAEIPNNEGSGGSSSTQSPSSSSSPPTSSTTSKEPHCTDKMKRQEAVSRHLQRNRLPAREHYH